MNNYQISFPRKHKSVATRKALGQQPKAAAAINESISHKVMDPHVIRGRGRRT